MKYLKPNSPELKKFFWITTIIVLVIPYLGAGILGIAGYTYDFLGAQSSTALAIAILWSAFYLVPTFSKKIKKSELAAAYFHDTPLFDIPVYTGIFPELLGVFQIDTETREIILVERSIAIITASPESSFDQGDIKKYKGDPLNRRMVIILSYILRYRIGSLIKVRQNAVSLEGASSQTISEASRSLHEESSRRTIPQIISHRRKIDRFLLGDLKKRIGEDDKESNRYLGLDVVSIEILDPNFPSEIEKGLKQIVETDLEKKSKILGAEAKRDTTIIIAQGEKVRLELEGRGKAWAKRFFEEARAIGLGRLAKELNMEEGSLIIQMETARRALEKANYSFVTAGGLSELFNFIPAATDAIKKIMPGAKL